MVDNPDKPFAHAIVQRTVSERLYDDLFAAHLAGILDEAVIATSTAVANVRMVAEQISPKVMLQMLATYDTEEDFYEHRRMVLLPLKDGSRLSIAADKVSIEELRGRVIARYFHIAERELDMTFEEATDMVEAALQRGDPNGTQVK